MFLALDLPEEAREQLSRWRDVMLGARSDVRPVRADALHVTLVFLGWQDESAADRIAATAFGALLMGQPPVLAAIRIMPVPPRNPRLFALDLEDEEGRATALQGAIAAALEEGGWHQPEKRPFW